MPEFSMKGARAGFRGNIDNLRRTVNTQGFERPAMEKIATPERREATESNPRLAEAPPVVAPFKLSQYEGKFALAGNAEQDVRAVTEADLDEIGEYLPRFQELFPDATPDAMLPLLKLATAGGSYKFLKTEDAYMLFGFSRVPWLPRGIVADMFSVGREGVPSAHQIVKMARVGLEWARSLGAAKFQLSEELEAVAKRLGCNEVARWFVKDLD